MPKMLQGLVLKKEEMKITMLDLGPQQIKLHIIYEWSMPLIKKQSSLRLHSKGTLNFQFHKLNPTTMDTVSCIHSVAWFVPKTAIWHQHNNFWNIIQNIVLVAKIESWGSTSIFSFCLCMMMHSHGNLKRLKLIHF